MENSPFIDGLPGFYLFKMVIFHGKLLNNQMVVYKATCFVGDGHKPKESCNGIAITKQLDGMG
jgi:hypothetical protein